MKNQYEIDYQQGYDTANDEWLDRIDKIKAEIEQITDTMGVSYNQYVSKIDVLQIIDKYRESEDKE